MHACIIILDNKSIFFSEAGDYMSESKRAYKAALPPPSREGGITVRQAAARLRLSLRRVRVLCEQGRIPGATKIGRDWVLPDPPAVNPPRGTKPRQS